MHSAKQFVVTLHNSDSQQKPTQKNHFSRAFKNITKNFINCQITKVERKIRTSQARPGLPTEEY